MDVDGGAMERSVHRFHMADQTRFAALSGDCNPLHLDALAARRTQAGAPVVHGVHLLMWLLDHLAATHADLPPLGSLKVRCDKMVYLGDAVRALVHQASTDSVRADLVVDDAVALRLVLGRAEKRATPTREAGPRFAPAKPIELRFDEIARQSGLVAFASPPGAIAAGFPAAARVWGERALAALVATTRLVGMTCPGLHSIFGGVTLHATDPDDGSDTLSFRVDRCDARFRSVRMQVSGGGLAGTVESFARTPPVQQQAMGALAGLVAADAFRDIRALIIGGSRGLGEITAKLLAAGGAQVVLTYASGKRDADALVAEIEAAGGEARAIGYDAREPALPQLADLGPVPNQLYFMATPPIFRRKAGFFDGARLADFNAFYVHAFWDAFATLRGHDPALTAFYPSSVAVEERPADMTEYAMAKAAGEALCRDINAFLAPGRVVVSRLPRLPTDQTATLQVVEAADPVSVMLPILGQMTAATRAGRT